MAFPNVSDVVTTTIEHRSKKAADNVTRNNALFRRLEKKGNVRSFDGGRTIWQEVEYALNGTANWYSGYEVLNIAPQSIFSAAEFYIRQAAVAVSISGLEELQNAGEEQMINLIAGRVKNAENSLTTLIASSGVYSDGTNAKAIGGLQFLVASSPSTGVVGGIDRSAWQFWRNISYSSLTNGGAAATSANIRRYMDAVYVQLVRGTDKPDLLVADNNYWLAYNESLQPLQRITDAEMAEAGYQSLVYMGSPVVLDGGFQGFTSDPSQFGPTSGGTSIGGVPANTMYFLNTDYIYYRPHSRRNFKPLSPDRHSVNQDAMVKLIGWAGNMTVSNARLQGVLVA
jgi:hypothetical protein